jgi:hypothetical protein
VYYVPLIMKPKLTPLKTCSWIPLTSLLKLLVELRSSKTNMGTAYLIHPQPSLRRDVFKVLSEELSLPIQPFAKWVKALEDLARLGPGSEYSDQRTPNQLLEDIPAVKTVEFYKGALEREGDSSDAMGVPPLAMTEALAALDILRKGGSFKKFNPKDICSWLEYWRGVGFIP